MKKFSLIGLMLTVSMSLYAKTVELVKITNDEDRASEAKFYVEVNEDNELLALSGKKFISGVELKEDAEVYDDSLLSTEGIVMEKVGKRKVVVLRSDNFHVAYGGELELVYLENGATGSRGSFHMSLELVGGEWKLMHKGKQMTHIHLYSKKYFGKTVGVKYIKVMN